MATPRNGGKGADAAARPEAIPVVAENVPPELKALARWVLWRYEWNAHKGKWDKPPLSPRTGHKTSWLRPGGWAGFDAAVAAYRAGKGGARGVGLVLSTGPDDPLDLAVIDLDVPGLEDALRPLATYVEHSPTAAKGGCHAWIAGGLPPGVRSLSGRVEVYAGRRFVCVTGDPLPWSPSGVARPAPDALAAALRALGALGPEPGHPEPPPVEAREAVEALPSAEDERLLAAAMGASNGAAFRRLWEGDLGEYRGDDGRPDASRADLALCNFLAFYWQKEPVAVDRMFRRSGLFRPEKWDARHYQTGETYGEHTVGMAVRGCRATYSGTRRTANGEAVRPRASTAPGASTGGGPAGAGGDGRVGAPPAPGAAGGGWLRGSDLPDADPDWFWEPYVERGDLSLLVGRTGAGKSHLLAELASRARRPAILPGFEEGRGGKLRRRLVAAGVRIEDVLWNPRRYYLPSEQATLLAGLRALAADLLLIDPAISYLDPGLHPNGEEVRPFLECLAQMAADLSIPVVGVRHSGKARGNPVKGSTAWEEVPRSVIELVAVDGRRVLRHYKSGQGEAAPPRYFTISGPGQAGRLALGKAVNPSLAAALDAQADPDEADKLAVAMQLIKRCMTDGTGQLLEKREAGVVLGCGRAAGLSESTMHRARRALGVKSQAEEHGPGTKSHWHPPENGWPEE